MRDSLLIKLLALKKVVSVVVVVYGDDLQALNLQDTWIKLGLERTSIKEAVTFKNLRLLYVPIP